MSPHEVLRGFTPPVVWNFAKRLRNRRPRFYGLDKLDEKIAQYLPYNDGFFVELGANDGINQSNTLYFERYKNWKGILVEPIPHSYLLCLANRSQSTRVFCNACTSFDYKERFVEIAFANTMSSALNLESDIPDPMAHANRGERLLSKTDRVFTFGALATPLNALLVEARAPRTIDLLSLDVEGAEIEVLKGVDHERFRFRYMCVECRNIEKLSAYLTSVGYLLKDKLSHHDYLFAGPAKPSPAARDPTADILTHAGSIFDADHRLTDAVRTRLNGNAITRGSDLSVNSEEGHVYLGGVTNSPEILSRAIAVALETPGVDSVRCRANDSERVRNALRAARGATALVAESGLGDAGSHPRSQLQSEAGSFRYAKGVVPCERLGIDGGCWYLQCKQTWPRRNLR